MIFGRHDLVQDAPISRLDLLVCRNTLMYFNAETQAKILNRFHFALNDSGFLFLGKAEMLLTHANLFTPVNLQHRIFSLIATTRKRDRPILIADNINFVEEELNNNSNFYWQLRELAFDTGAIAQIIIDLNGTIVLANASARSQFGINSLDLGQPLQDLEISYRPLELRSHIERLYQEGQTIIIEDVVRNLNKNQTQYLDVQFIPLEGDNGEILGVSILFIDVTRYHDLQAQLQQANQELETANEELQSSHGGFIDVSSELKCGTQFEIFLPAIEVEKIEPKVSTSVLPEGKGELILVVDDEKDNLYMTQVLLETSGYRVLSAKDGLEAIAIFEQHNSEIELVLMDMMMPNLDGFNAISELVKITPQLKVIGLSGLIDEYSLAHNSKVKAFLAKPITAESLLTTIALRI